jgi:NAD(P)-dependent dehydrogenase (short-subunit alcohol dehydrogenase family)
VKLDEMICVVTGASGATGSVIVEVLGEKCRAVVGVTRGVEVDWHSLGGNRFEVTANILNQTSVGFLVSEVLRHLDSFHVWINVVGGFNMGGSVEETESEDWPKMFDLNFISMLNCCRKTLPVFNAQQFGCIINFGSAVALNGMAQAAPYAVSKAAVVNLTKTIALEGKESGITANVIVPMIIDTPANRKAMPEADFSKWTPPVAVADAIVEIVKSGRSGGVIRV